jgi:ABC-2 type transport system ATP-binding protein
MADRIGVINKGEIILVEDKAELMQQARQEAADAASAGRRSPRSPRRWRLQADAVDGRRELTYTYDTKGERTGITSLLERLRDAGIRFKDLRHQQSSLEDIFVSLVRAP